MAPLITFLSVLTCLFFQTACAVAPLATQATLPTQGDYSFLREQISHLIQKKMKKDDITGLSIAVVDDQKIVWADGFGWADKKNNVKATPETVYRVGSISKLFTVTAAMQLAEQGKLDIDQPLHKALPQFSMKSHFKKPGTITPRNIMTHHSGLPSNYMQGMWSNQPDTFTHLVDRLQDEYIAYPSDTVFCYSNLAMTLLGHALQEISGRPYGELISKKLLIPLAMSDSYIANTLKNEPQSSKGYAESEETMAIPLRDLPAGGLNSTVQDLANLAKMVFAGGRFDNRQIIRAATLKKMMQFQDGNAPFDLEEQMGLGWFLKKQKGGDVGLKAMHGGDTFLFHSMLTTLPRHRLAVIVLANSESAGDAVSEIAEDTLKLALQVKTGIVTQDDDKKVSGAELPAKPEDLDGFPGYYFTVMGLVRIMRDGDQLQLISDGDTLQLILHQDGQYYLQYKLLGLFHIDLEELEEIGINHAEVNGLEVLVGTFRGQKVLLGEKIEPQPIAASWKNRIGTYEIIHPQSGMVLTNPELRLIEGFLMFRFSARLPYQKDAEEANWLALNAIDERNAVIHGLGSDFGETIRVVQQNGEELLAWSGYLLRRVR